MVPQQSSPCVAAPAGDGSSAPPAALSDLSLVLRNYDGDVSRDVAVRFLDANDEPAFDRTVTVGPLETVGIRTRLERAVYRVDARVANGDRAEAECLVGSGPNEVALVELGNGIVSVAEGFW